MKDRLGLGWVWRVSLAVALFVLFGVAPALGQATSRFTGDPASGQSLFSEKGCVRCHSIWGNGGDLGPDLGEVGRGRSLLQLAGMFWNHTPRMIETVQSRGFEWPTFTDSDLADVISYVYYVKLFDPPGDPELGRQWFAEKRCQECHSVGGEGGRVGPPLDSYARFIAPLPLAAGMWNHGKAMREKQRGRGVPLPQFVGAELADIQAFIRASAIPGTRDLTLMRPPDVDRGKRLFRSKGCTTCHGSAGRGTALAPDLRQAIQQLRASEIAGELWNHSARITDAMVRNGVPFPEFASDELADVLSYLYYLRYEELSGDARAGRTVFESKGCAGCHDAGRDGSIGPDLTESEVVHEPMRLTAAMWNHAPSMYARVREAGIAWPLFQNHEMRDLAAYLRGVAR
jgi:cytochrome c2